MADRAGFEFKIITCQSIKYNYIMKQISFFTFILGFNLMFSQNQTSSLNKALELEKTESLNKEYDEPPVYPGGINAFRNNFAKTFDASRLNFNEMVKSEVTFKIDSTGYITEITARGSDRSMNKEMERTIKAMSKTKWKPAKIKGKPVRSTMRFPMTINNH